MVQREVGVQTAPCHDCGKALPTVERPDGSVAAIPCGGSCKQAPAVETAQAVVPAPPSLFQTREHGVDDDVDDNEEDS